MMMMMMREEGEGVTGGERGEGDGAASRALANRAATPAAMRCTPN